VTAAHSLFIYFRVRRESESAVVSAVRALQASWQLVMPGLICELLRRADEGGEVVTLMETYSCADGVHAQWQQRIELEAAQRLAPWLIGERHVELFEPCA
jgi:hypothetical protein